ncbi:hypothetical protein [Eubacterium ventriosum]|uniref:hypothetical protein n=2 Tax=Eubacterium ventriosum TaxID=39496 RepID=UPI003992609E
MIVGILLLVVAIINIMEAFRKQKNKLIFRTCNYLVFPVVYLICCLFNIFGDINLYLYGMIIVIIEKLLYLFMKKKLVFQLEKLEYRIWIRKIRNTITETALILKAIQIFIICRADITMQRWEEFLRRNLVKRYMNKYHKHVCITSEIQDNAYDELMNWLESKCDSFSFCLPHFGKVVVTESNADIYPEYEIGYVEEDEESKKDYEQYRRRVQKYLENISEYIIENYVDIEYCETISGYEKEIFIIKFNNITKKFF